MAARDAGEAINLLSLDDGGVRGAVLLHILHEIMVQIQLCYDLKRLPKPCEYFHMIGGTGTGGLIAIMLGRLRMSTEEALQEYGRCVKEMFSLGNRKWTTATERYRATGLKEAVENLVRRRNLGDDLVDLSLEPDSKGLCFVCAMPVSNLGQPRRFRSFYTPKDIYKGVKIWEAVRATTAASFYFKPMSVTAGGREPEEFANAAINCNSPINYALRESAAHFGAKRRLGTIVSIGTGITAVGVENSKIRSRATGKELIGRPENLETDAEVAHRDIEERLGPSHNAYFRFNVPDVADEAGLDKYLKIHVLQASTAAYLADPSVMAQMVRAALALDNGSVFHELSLGRAAGVGKWKGDFKSYATQFLGEASRFFTARDSVLQKMDVFFSPRDAKGKPRREFLLFGPSGVGKTQIALKFANQVEKRFKYIFHIDGSNPSSVSQTYANICEQYCPRYSPRTPNDSADVEDMKQVALDWISGLSVEWLIIYDNVPDSNLPGCKPFGPELPGSGPPGFMPTLPGQNIGNIIYTSQSQGMLANLPPNCTHEVGPFTVEEGLQVLLNLVGLENVEENNKEIEALRETAVEVGCLPFALDTAGVYLRKEGCTPLMYLRRFRERQNRLGLRGEPTRSGLYTALELSYEALLDMHQSQVSSLAGVGAAAASAILNLFCFYHNVDIPFLMMGLSAEELRNFEGTGVHPLSEFPNPPLMSPTLLMTCRSAGKGWDSTALHLGIQCLLQFSLVKWNTKKDTVSMHPLVQDWARDRMSTDARRYQAWAAQVVLIESIKSGWGRLDRATLRGLPPHLDVCMSYESESFGQHDKHQAWLDLKLAWYCYEKRMLLEAVKLIEKALRLQKRNHGNYSREATNCLRILGRVSFENGYLANAEAAEPNFEAAVDYASCSET
ncbi:acyl transferase/acyl hydrolase/lysophospholipase [Dichotomopilus funicola]|uniref:Acyl transferase/acyl hydrolase/lysophospholipase n=1 Tax=Dichotomopilus funicola TaxID=1934379 RepID=A0AAN6V609_9PEZI|nr:acyl transferase/acyl hydrolase/lysophospholipase [Dichotomopilus funicola]